MMFAATGAADFTPDPGHVLQGHAGSPPSHRVLHPLQARAIVFAEGESRVGICTVDVIGLMSDVTARVRRRVTEVCGLPGTHLLLAASHTHCAPAAINCLGMVPDPAFLAAQEEAMVASVTEAVSRLEPVTLGLGCGSATFNINRRLPSSPDAAAGQPGGPHPGGVVDRRARLLRVDREDGSPLAVLFNFSCHPVTKTGMSGAISSDYPGVARARIEEALDCHALFLPGSFGNVRPAVLHPDAGGFADASDEQLLTFGTELGDTVVTATGYTRTRAFGKLAAALMPLELSYAGLPSRDELQRIAAEDASDLRVGRAWAERLLGQLDCDALPSSTVSEMQALRIGPLLCVAIPGESVQEIGYEIEKRLVRRGDVDDIWAMGYCNDMLGYLMTERHKLERGYEPQAYRHFERPAPFQNEYQVVVEKAEEVAKMV